MTTASVSETVAAASFPTGTVLAALATVLLVFVSFGVLYLSTVEWRDKRRRRAQEGRGR